jgi:hypothetical protein
MLNMTESQIRKATIAIWKLRQPDMVQRQRQVEARREIESRRLEMALCAAIGCDGNEDMKRELDALTSAF